MRIYLVTPRNPRNFWTYDAILPLLDKDCLYPNLSMPTLAGLTPSPHELILADENVEPIDFDVEADVVGVTGYLVHRERMLEIIGEFRRRGRMVVVGGPYASLCPEELRGHCDVLFVDEAEETWPQFLADLEAGRWQREYRPAEKPELCNAPMPRFDLLPVDRYFALTVQFARGCPYSCEFCDIIVIYGRRPRAKTTAQLMREIAECHRLGARQVFVVDDNFIGNRRLAKELLRELAAWSAAHGHPLCFQTELTLNVAEDEELLALLRDAHFTTVFVGIESPRRASLAETRKTQNLRGRDMVTSVRKIQAYGIQVQAGMIVGFDHDDDDVFAEQLAFIQEARIPVSMTGMLQALPKTPLHARVAAEGRLLSRSDGDHFVGSNISPKQMTRVQLLRGYRWLIAELYGFGNYRRRVFEFLRNRGTPVGRAGLPSRHDLLVFARVLWRSVVLGERRRARFALGLLAQTLAVRPSVFRDAVSFLVVHQALSGYVDELVQHLDRGIAALESGLAENDAPPPASERSAAG